MTATEPCSIVRLPSPTVPIGPIPDTTTADNLHCDDGKKQTVEVLKGKISGSNHARRRGDRQGSDQRALSWIEREGDMALYPHSPLALSDVLSAKEGCFDLVAEGASKPMDEKLAQESSLQTNAATSLQQRRQRSNPRTRANLLTQLNQNQLLECCKRIQIENALVKQAGVRRLYLTAGFLTWQHSDDDGEHNFRAPILFYPATLIRKANVADEDVKTHSANTAACQNDTETSAVEYEIRLSGALPDTNKALAHWCEQNLQLNIPEYDGEIPLQDYFTQLAQVISDESSMEIQFDIALGNAAPPIPDLPNIYEPPRLPDLPEHFDTTLAMAITGNKNLRQLHSVLNLLGDYSDINAQTKRKPGAKLLAKINSKVSKKQNIPTAANEASGVFSGLHEYSKKLSGAGLSTVQFEHLPSLPDNISNWVENVNKAMQSQMVTTVLSMPKINARHLIRLASVIELIDKAPLNIDQFNHADLCYAATPGLLQRAQHQAQLIEDELSTLQNTFVLDKVPAKKQLLSLINELGGHLDDGPDIVDADYFSARRQFMEFSIEKPTNLTPEHRNLLGKLAKVLRFRELFVNNVEYRLALGPGYRGLRTNWEDITAALGYAQELTEVLESESIASCAMGQWTTFRSAYIQDLKVLQKGAESLRKLLWICGSEWQTREVTEVVEHASNTRVQLLEWSEKYGEISAKVPSGENKTPANVLAQFTGKSREDVLTEIHVGETQATIDEHINAGTASHDAVLETIDWLRKASETANDLHLEINAIVDHVGIA